MSDQNRSFDFLIIGGGMAYWKQKTILLTTLLGALPPLTFATTVIVLYVFLITSHSLILTVTPSVNQFCSQEENSCW